MKVDLKDITSADIARELDVLREEGGVVALGRVLTLVVVASNDDAAERAIAAANLASREHPARVIVVKEPIEKDDGTSGMDAEIRVGADAGASEIVVVSPYGQAGGDAASVIMPLLLPDAPIVAWWSGEAPEDLSATSVGQLAQRRITDAAFCSDPTLLDKWAQSYSPGDTDLAWAQLTLWRGLLAAALEDANGSAITGATVRAQTGSVPARLLSGWLALSLGLTVTCEYQDGLTGIGRVSLERQAGDIVLEREVNAGVAQLSTGPREPQTVALPRRTGDNALSEDLRQLNSDDVYGRVLTQGLDHVTIKHVS